MILGAIETDDDDDPIYNPKRLFPCLYRHILS